MENSQINPTNEMDNALSVECPGPGCDCPSCVYGPERADCARCGGNGIVEDCVENGELVEGQNPCRTCGGTGIDNLSEDREMDEAVAEARNTGLWRHPSEVQS